MTRYLLVAASCAWVTLMLIVWSLFTPKGLTVDSFILLALSGPLLLAVAAKLWNARRPHSVFLK